MQELNDRLVDMNNQMLDLWDSFQADVVKGIEKDNKAAFRRARQASLALEKLFKEFRKQSPK